ncbi:NAD(P)-dependent oxidoreductase [Nocardia bhagyanarayanae]|uniref:3-hydroxyisobutyrate dehydrogenase-like beta-hydroxyacid dehydrogenase n=1 Tax=Nocardia bhagyanarayanae TaxID=1215925 RepID=A0A543FGH2_9NOCA|nr:NAD(P)-binding domain-containing protein [Nocardia bhagyanarayanae]TQM32968.1 3-hydroxyisobutyrate dehydrogenase-like beta-hydroxyacid dehydrogenase [Nocardia bhagyanarayanae]
MAENQQNPVTVLGLGAMGQALAAAFLKTGRPTTVWNRTPGKDADLVAAGAVGAATVEEAVNAGEVIVVVLLDHASVHAALDPVAERLSGKQVINLTSTAPEESRELGRWAERHGIDYLDGGIMAVPPMIGQPGASILYSGSPKVFDGNRELLESAAAADYFGEDAGLAATWDFALLSNMYAMFAGFLHGAALVRSTGASASAFAERATAWVTAMAQLIPEYGRIIDGGDYTTDVQHLNFHKAAMDAIVRASRDAGVALDVIGPIKTLIDRQVADGHGALAFERTFEELR